MAPDISHAISHITYDVLGTILCHILSYHIRGCGWIHFKYRIRFPLFNGYHGRLGCVSFEKGYGHFLLLVHQLLSGLLEVSYFKFIITSNFVSENESSSL